MATFQLVLVIGIAAIVGLAALGFFPLAVAAALVLVPLMMVLYVWEVDVYEDEPLRVMVYTAGWGIVTGAIVGLAIRALVPAEEGLLGGTSGGTILVRGVVIPLIGAALMLAGPLVLLPYRKFNDVLDGATFGATAAVTFVAAQAFTQALELFGSGLRPAGDPLPWIVRLLSLGIASPLIAAGSIGSAVGAIWLRFRAPVADRHRLGLVGRPIVAVVAAAALLVAAAIGQLVLPFTAALIWLAILAVVRAALAARGDPPGPAPGGGRDRRRPRDRCPNCGRLTASAQLLRPLRDLAAGDRQGRCAAAGA